MSQSGHFSSNLLGTAALTEFKALLTEQDHATLCEHVLYLQSLVDSLSQGISVFDKQLRLTYWNRPFLKALDIPEQQAYVGTRYEDILMLQAQRGEFGAGDPAELVAKRSESALQFTSHKYEYTRSGGKTTLVEGYPLVMDGQIQGLVTRYSDATGQKQIAVELQRKNDMLQTLVDNIPGGVTLFDANFNLLVHNQEFVRLLDFPPELFQGTPQLADFFRFNAQRGEYGPGDWEVQVEERLATARLGQPHLFKRTRPNGRILEIRGLPLSDGGFVTIYTDISAQQRAAEAIERLAHRDALTGLANRYSLEARLDQLVADAKRHSRSLAIMFLDMDNFKTVNDTLGHSVGDQFLHEVARRLRSTVRDNDIVARLGGDEFVVVLAELEDKGDVATVASKIIDSLSHTILVGAHKLSASVSIGICFYPDDGQDRGALMQSADIAMYHAKNSGKGVFRCFNTSMLTATTQRLEMERALREAVDLQHFVLHFQPQMDAKTQRPMGVEALIRWQKPTGELIGPNDFIPLAEELGLIEAVGGWALSTACHTLARWHQQGMKHLSIAVNLSAIQLRNPLLPQRIAVALYTSGLPGHALTLEITESVAMENPMVSIERLGMIRALGVRLALDDFGTGYSSLSYLKRLPLDYLKVDRTFVKDLETDPHDAAICTATIGLAHNMGFTVIAEGVETEAQRQYLENLNCDAFQGYLFSRPLPEAAVLEWLRAR